MRETIQNANGKQFHAVSLSGGKDSTAMLLLMIERDMPINMVLSADTGMEFPEMYEHLAKLDEHLFRERGIHITTLRHPKGFEYQQYGFTSPEQLEAAVDTAYQKMRQTSGELKALETKLQGKKKLQRQVLAYAQTKAARDGLRAQKSEKARAAYRQAHESDFIIADAAARYFKAHGITKLPARKALQAEIEQLISEKDGLYNTYHEQKQRFKELQTVKRNIDQILRREEPHRRKEQSHER